MQYKYVSVYKIRGLVHPPEKEDVEIYKSEDGTSVRAVLTNNIDDYCYELYSETALEHFMLKELFTGQQKSDDVKIEMDKDIKKIREDQHKSIDNAEVFIFTASGEIGLDPQQQLKELEDLSFGLRLFNKREIVDTNRPTLNAALTALYLSTEQTVQIKCVNEGIYLIDESGKPVFSFAMSGGADYYSTIPTPEEDVIKAKGHAGYLASEKSLATVNRLLVQAISRDSDNLRQFIFAWTALEIFIEKLFSEYEKLFVNELIKNAPGKSVQRYFDRIRGVMQGKYNLADKFLILSACLCDNPEPDIKLFKSIKDTREGLFHRQDVDESALPVNQTLNLLKKYLKSHLGKKSC